MYNACIESLIRPKVLLHFIQLDSLIGKPLTTIAEEVMNCLHSSFDLATATNILSSFTI